MSLTWGCWWRCVTPPRSFFSPACSSWSSGWSTAACRSKWAPSRSRDALAMEILSQLLAAVGVLTAGIIYGTDMLGALIGRPTWAKVDDRALVMVSGYMHYFGDRRFPVPGIASVVTTVLATATSAIGGRWAAAAAGLVGTIALLTWLAIYFRVNAPINRVLTLAAQENRVP